MLSSKFEFTLEDKIILVKFLVVAMVLFVIGMVIYFISPFIGAIGLAALMSIFMYRFKNRLVDKFGGHEKKIVFGMLFVVVCTFIVPATISGIFISSEVAKISNKDKITHWQNEVVEAMREFVDKHPKSEVVLGTVIEFASKDQSQVVGILGFSGLMKKFGGTMLNFVSSAFTKIGSFIFNMIVTVIALGAFLLYGDNWISYILQYVPIQLQEKKQIVKEIYDGMNVLFDSMIAVGLGQGTLGAIVSGIYFWFYHPIGFGTFLILWFIMVVSSACSMSMTFPVIISCAGMAMFQGNFFVAVLLVVMSIVTAGSDNIIKMKVLGSDESKVPMLVMLMFIIGGMAKQGMLGVVFAPFFAIMCIAMARIFFKDIVPEETGTVPAIIAE